MKNAVARRLFQLVEPVAVVTYMADEPTEAVMALGLRNVWDAYFAGRAAPLGRDVPAEVVHALFYNFAAGEVARHMPRAQLVAVVDGMRSRGLVGADGWLTAAGRQATEWVDTLTDKLAAPAYDILDPDELDQLVADLEPLAAVLVAAGSQ